ncbi:PREDICTED: ribosome-recycling factor, chloroplastic [Populus euphratica]|uniref:Ribosome-recycling factor, chloroplastic n=1 Tax=Populus euphratica TaxID=75702 RepID=A0AAJ6XP67_POPEU|nr:PREDICTED: ribosome-recycling factor, chloroplastic [Populus euphratica]
MAAPFSSPTTPPPLRSFFQPNPNPPKALLSLTGSFHRGPHRAKVGYNSIGATSVSLWSSSANYSSLRNGSTKLSGKPVAAKRLLQNRRGVVRNATIEEIEAEKSLIEDDAKGRMEKTIDTMRANFNSVRTGRANPSMLDKIEVEYYGTPVSLKSIAQISTPDASSLLVQPYDKSSLKAIEKAIVSSDLGLTPNNDGEVIRMSIPQLTSERRKELSKMVAKLAEEGKVALRNIRRDALKAYEKLEKEKKLSEDNVKDLSSDLQKLTDEYMKKIDNIFKQKEKELLKV